MKQSTIQSNVLRLLEEYPPTRNDDRVLVDHYIRNYHYDIYHSTFSYGLNQMLRGKIPRFETICRHSRTLQAKHEHLGGTNRKERIAKQDKIKVDQGYLKDSERYVMTGLGNPKFIPPSLRVGEQIKISGMQNNGDIDEIQFE